MGLWLDAFLSRRPCGLGSAAAFRDPLSTAPADSAFRPRAEGFATSSERCTGAAMNQLRIQPPTGVPQSAS
jgi:hypothetical protein